MTAEHIVRTLDGRWSGRSGTARCPAHNDRSPSLSMTERDGRVLVHCHAGCAQADVIAALRGRGLWPERERPAWTPQDRARWAADWRIRQDALYFADAARVMAEWALEELSPVDLERFAHTSLLAALRVSPEAEYRAWLERDPKSAHALVEAGRERQRRLQTGLVHFIIEELSDGRAA